MIIHINMNTDDHYIEFMGLRLSPEEAKDFADRLITATNDLVHSIRSES